MLVPEYVDREPYVGFLFILGGISAAYVAFRLWQQDEAPTWLAGGVVAAAMAAAFILSRTIGLPGFKENTWQPIGIAALVAEVAYVALCFASNARRAARTERRGSW